MCGIAGIHIKNPKAIKSHEGLETFINHLFLEIEHRGRDASGFVACTFPDKNGKPTVVIDKTDSPAKEFIKTRSAIPEGVQTVLLHTRLWTKGEPNKGVNNHPVIHKTCFAVHNGHVGNDDALFEQYKLERAGEVDSEIIPALAYHIGLDDPAEFMKQFDASIATAIIDPYNFPGRLVLAKGRYSPIRVFENHNFVVWASVDKAIREAWAHVIGTPPAFNKIQTMKEGDIWIYDGAVRSEETFVVPPSIKASSASKHTPQNGQNGVNKLLSWQNGETYEEWQKRTATIRRREERKRQRKEHRAARKAAKRGEAKPSVKFVTPLAAAGITSEEKRMATVRKTVEEERVAATVNPDNITWLSARLLSTITEEERKLLWEETKKESLTWLVCGTCGAHVLDKDFKDTPNWGRVCLDCHHATILYLRTLYVPETLQADEEEEDDGPWLLPEVIATLDTFVSAEVQIHTEALEALSEETEIDEHILEWIIFRMPDSYVKSHALMGDVQDQFDTMYQEYCETLWEEKEGDPDPEVSTFRGIEEDSACNVPQTTLCAAHNYWYDEKGCPDCDYAIKLPNAADGHKCECGRFIYKTAIESASKWCFFCRKEGKDQPQLLLEAGPPIEGMFTEMVPTKCCCCPNDAVFYRPLDASGHGWCLECVVGCADENNPKVKCETDSNHVAPDGTRYCHFHARGMAGLVSDTLMEKQYGEYVEIGKE